MSPRVVAALLAVGLSMLATVAGAQPVYTHAVQEGDTLASVAQRYYADPTREAVLREANRMKGSAASDLVTGSWIFVPMVSFYRVSKDETWKSIAARFYGRPSRSTVLIEANKGNKRVEP
ncbi:MAG: LysM domain-containing protein, partial [Deltaproteobacteria bacterium]